MLLFCLRSHGRWLTAALLLGSCLLGAFAQQPPPRKQQGDATRKVLHEGGENQCTYRAWVEEDVRWIVSSEERASFEQLSNDQEREQFVEQFWRRRDPTPETIENEYKQEHYRRIAYSNLHFGAVGPGWKSDRGRAYIVLGPPDEIDHPPAPTSGRPEAETSIAVPGPPEEVWRYRYRKPLTTPHSRVWSEGRLNQEGATVILRFVDTCRCGDYRLVLDSSQRDPFNIHFHGDRPGGLVRYPSVKYKELEEVVTRKIVVKRVPFDVIIDSAKRTRCTFFVPVSVRINHRDLTFVRRSDGEHAAIHVFGRFTALTGRVVNTFEAALNVDSPSEPLATARETMSAHQTEVLLFPGRYRLDLVVEDVNGDRIGTWNQGVLVPTPE